MGRGGKADLGSLRELDHDFVAAALRKTWLGATMLLLPCFGLSGRGGAGDAEKSSCGASRDSGISAGDASAEPLLLLARRHAHTPACRVCQGCMTQRFMVEARINTRHGSCSSQSAMSLPNAQRTHPALVCILDPITFGPLPFLFFLSRFLCRLSHRSKVF